MISLHRRPWIPGTFCHRDALSRSLAAHLAALPMHRGSERPELQLRQSHIPKTNILSGNKGSKLCSSYRNMASHSINSEQRR
jgi:hypothetical protein